MSLIYTNIQHGFRKENGLTLNEYVICDMVFFLCKDSTSKVPGWCYMTKENMGKEMSLSKQSVMTLSKKMIDFGFLEKQEFTGFLKTTSKWEKVYFTDGKESSPKDKKDFDSGKESLPHDGKESLLYNNTLDNNSNKKERTFLFSESIWNSYDTLRAKLALDEKFKKEYAGVDLRRYIEDCLTWSVAKNNKSTDYGWYLTLRKWMRDAKDDKSLKMLPEKDNCKPKGHINF